MANTLLLGIGIPLAPVTLLYGPTATFTVALTLGMSGTAFGWYWLFSRKLRLHQIAAAIGGAVVGFGPAAISHAHGHVNFVFGLVLPWIVMSLMEAGPHGDRFATESSSAYWSRGRSSSGKSPCCCFPSASGSSGSGFWRSNRHAVRWLRRAVRPIGVAVATTVVLAGVPIAWQFRPADLRDARPFQDQQ